MKTLEDVKAIVVNEAFKSFEEFRKEKMKFIKTLLKEGNGW